jgi:hypothetical protein
MNVGSVTGRAAANPVAGRSLRSRPAAWPVEPTASVLRRERELELEAALPELTTPPGGGAGLSATRDTAVPRREASDGGRRLGARDPESLPPARTGALEPLPPPLDDEPPEDPPDPDEPDEPDELPPTGRGIACASARFGRAKPAAIVRLNRSRVDFVMG